MQSDLELTAVYAILGQAHIAADVYDPKGAFVLLDSISTGLGDATPRFIDIASHLHIVAALGDNEATTRNARRGLACLVDVLEQRLTLDAAARADGRTPP